MALAVISAACSSQTKTKNQRNATSEVVIQIEMNFGKPARLQLTNATIGQLSSGVFQLVVGDEHEACQLAKIINPDLSPCIREDEDKRERKIDTEPVISDNDTTKQRKTTEHKLSLANIVSAKEPPDVLLQAGRDQNEGPREREENGTSFSRNNTAKQHKMPENNLSKIHSSISANELPAVLLQAGRDLPSEHPRATTSSNVNQDPQQYLPIPHSSPSKPAIGFYSSRTRAADYAPPDVLLQANPLHQQQHTGTSSHHPINAALKPTTEMHRRLSACTFDTGLCTIWYQNTRDFDWTLSTDNEGTPTSNTGPSTGAGGSGAFMFIEANDQAEGAIAAVTSSLTGCGLYIDYHMYGGGIGSLTVSSRSAGGGEDAAWVPVWTKEGDQGDSWQDVTIYSPSESYYQVIATRGGGIRGDSAVDNLNLLACTIAPTLAPTNIGQHQICNFNAGFCDWTQDGDDNFDWTLSSEGTPTSNTGPGTGSGHGGGAFIHIEANDQTEGAYAAITSSDTGCGLYVDYHMYGGGIGTLTVSAKNVADGDDAPWVPVWMKEGGQGDSWQAATIYSASGSYYRVIGTRGGGIRGDIAIDNLNVIWCSPAPTAAPTNEGDTHAPTASPTAAPTNVPTAAPTASPTATPTAAPTMNPPSNWNQLKSRCANSVCNTANGGCTIVLRDNFIMGSYTSEIDFSGKAITIWGRGKVLDASGGGRFFSAASYTGDAFLELHDAVLQNGAAESVSNRGLMSASR
jgi:hypothetical protein